MIIRTEDLKDVCQKILVAVDSGSPLSEAVEINVNKDEMRISVSNREYFCRVAIGIPHNEDTFDVTVSANTFLKLVSKFTSETVEIKKNEKSITVIGNGSYSVPLVMEDDEMLSVPEITIENETSSFVVKSSDLLDVMNYNTKEILKNKQYIGASAYYYLDENGCITFSQSSGACVTNFKSGFTGGVLLTQKVVKLFRLFKTDDVEVSVGYGFENGLNQQKIRFNSGNVLISAKLMSDNQIINSVPAKPIREHVEELYPYVIVVNRAQLLDSLNRIMIMSEVSSSSAYPSGKLVFNNDCITIYSSDNNSSEKVYTSNGDSGLSSEYEARFHLDDIRYTLENSKEEFITMMVGNKRSMVIKKNNVYNLIAECVRG